MDRLANVAKQNIYFIPKGIDYHSNIKFVPCISELSAWGNYGDSCCILMRLFDGPTVTQSMYTHVAQVSSFHSSKHH